jgi:hypothetical protein
MCVCVCVRARFGHSQVHRSRSTIERKPPGDRLMPLMVEAYGVCKALQGPTQQHTQQGPQQHTQQGIEERTQQGHSSIHSQGTAAHTAGDRAAYTAAHTAAYTAGPQRHAQQRRVLNSVCVKRVGHVNVCVCVCVSVQARWAR